MFPHSNATLSFGREVLTRRYLRELQSARRELEARQNTPVRSDGAGPSGVHDGSAAAADDNACEEPELEYDSEDEEMFWNCIQAEHGRFE